MKPFLWTFVAVFGGIWLFSKWTARSAAAAFKSPSGNSYGVYAGPAIDPQTGAYNPLGNGAGTVNPTGSGLNPGDTMSGGDYDFQSKF